jgi:putative membrane protein
MMRKIHVQTPLLIVTILAGSTFAAGEPSTADVLGKLHRSNQKEIEMGKMAQEHGRSADVKSFGKTLVQDHTNADKKVAKLAKAQKIDLTASTPTAMADSDKLPMDAGFDAAFARMMLDDHKKDIAEAKAARDGTQDKKLKKLIDELLPVLEKHQETAQKLVDQNGKS